MPANLGSLPDIDEATAPFSSHFTNYFDRATVEATVPFADRTVYVAPDGRRYLFQQIPDTHAEDGRAVQSRSGSGSRRGSAHATAYSPAPAAPQTVTSSAAASTASTHPLPVLPTDYLALNNGAVRRRPPSVASASSDRAATSASRLPNGEASHAAIRSTPRVVTEEDVISGMANLNMHRFSATPFYPHSDGGVAAAEALTDLNPVPRLPIPPSPAQQSPLLPHSYSSPSIHAPAEGSSYTAQSHMERPYAGRSPSSGTTVQPASPSYDYNTHVAHMSRERHISLPSSMEQSNPPEQSPYANPNMHVSPVLSQQQSNYDHLLHGQVSLNFGHHNYHSPLPANGSAHPYSPQPGPAQPRSRSEGNTSLYNGQSQVGSPALAPIPRHYTGILAGESHFDTQTPVVVVDSAPLHPAQSNSSRSDGASTGRDNVLPGEEVLYDGPVKMTPDLSAPFQPGALKVFRNTLSHVLRFHCKVGYDTETYWMNGANAQLIPIYAYDQRFPNVLYIRDNELDIRNTQQGNLNPKPGGFYQFNRLQELVDFQAKLTGEKVVLDISSVRLMRTKKVSSRNNESFSSVRVQIWHEDNTSLSRRGTQSDVASFVTAGTALSGPLRNKQVPNSSRLMVFLGRLDEYITVFITDDIEVVADGQTMVKVKARKGGMLRRGVSRWPGVKGEFTAFQDLLRREVSDILYSASRKEARIRTGGIGHPWPDDQSGYHRLV